MTLLRIRFAQAALALVLIVASGAMAAEDAETPKDGADAPKAAEEDDAAKPESQEEDADPAKPTEPEPPLEPVAWQTPTVDEVKARVTQWLDAQSIDDDELRRSVLSPLDRLDESAGEDGMLDQVVRSIALVDKDVHTLLAECDAPPMIVRPEHGFLTDESKDALVIANARLYYGRWLIHHRLFDEAGAELSAIDIDEVVAPATLLFFKSVAHHQLLHRKDGLHAIDSLLEGPIDQVPRRYTAIAGLMKDDLSGLKDDSLDHIARRMGDIQRRLDLGRAGPRVRGIEDGVIESLDKLIEELEKQQQQSSSSSSSGGNQLQPSAPAGDSQIMGGNGPGHVTRRDIGDGANWGNLPPSQREQALQQIGRDFPSHYRDVIEQYFRRLASEKTEP